MLKRLHQDWDRFWFHSHGGARIALFKRVFFALLLWFYSVRTLDLGFLYSESGILPLETTRQIHDMTLRFSLFHWLTGDVWLWIVNGLFLLLLALGVLGRSPRWLTAITFVIHLSFIHRNMVSVFGADVISTFMLLYCALMDEKSQDTDRWGDLISSMGFRFAQVHVCVIYFYSGVEKLKGPSWWNGEAIWTAVMNAQLGRWDLSWISDWPLLIAIPTYLTVIWETYFPLAVWSKKLRYPTLFIGVLLHGGIALLMKLNIFSALMCSTYLLFLFESDAEKLKNTLKTRFNSLGSLIKL